MQPARRRPGFAGLVSLLAVWILESTGPTQAVAQDAVIRVLSPVEGDILSASEEVLVVCDVVGDLQVEESQYSVGVDFNGQEGGTFEISASGQHTFSLEPRGTGRQTLLVSLFRDGGSLSEQSLTFSCDDGSIFGAPDDIKSDPAAAADPRDVQAPWKIAVTSPRSCENLGTTELVLSLQVVAPVNAPSEERSGHLQMELNGNLQRLPLESTNVTVVQMFKGLHVIVLRAVAADNKVLAEIPPHWFGVQTTFELDAVEKITGQLPTNGFSTRLAAEAYVCFSAYTHSVVPRLWVLLANVGEYARALEFLSLALRSQPGDPWFLIAYAASYFLGHAASCSPDSACYKEVLNALGKVLEAGVGSIDVMGGLNEIAGIVNPIAENDNSLALKSALLRAEMNFNRHRRPAPVHTYPPGHPCRADTRPFRCVVIFARQYLEELDDPWGPEKMRTGMGGANEAVIFMSRQLRERGYHVAVYGNPSAADIAAGQDEHGVEWFPFWAYDETNSPGVFVVWWHHQDAVAIGRNAHSRFLWFHYQQYAQRYTPAFMETIDGAFAMSHYHAAQMPDFAHPKTVVSANGIDPALFVDGINDPKRFIYASHPFYGLETLLKVWPKIHARVPGSTLEVYYGWTKGMLQFLERNGDRGKRFKNSIDTMLKADGIVNKGMVGQRELTEALSGCGFYLYTCEIGEISSISLMRAQAMGAVPITSRHTDSALNETAGWFDLGPPGSPGLIGRDPERLEAWVERVIYVANHASDFDEHRREMKAWARATFSWRRAGDQWDRIFQEGLRGPGSMDIDRIAPAQIPLHTRSTHPEL